jgi:signal transduction histidine kinase
LTVRGQDHVVSLEVRDDGEGIGPEHLPHLFDAFFTTKGSRGTGLGLACCKKIIESHHGRIRIESTPGKGTTVLIEFPRISLEEMGTQFFRRGD